jgi:hypothetical protein
MPASSLHKGLKLLAVHLFPKLFAWPETYGLPFFDGNSLTRAWIPAFSGRFIPYGKGAEMYEFYGFTRHHRTLHIIEKAVDNKSAVTLRKSKLIC